MNYKDTLELYDELISGGCTEAQARGQARPRGDRGIGGMMARIEKDLVWMRIIGAAMTASFLVSAYFHR